MRLILTFLAAIAIGVSARAADVRDELVGQWVGDSLCTPVRKACHDENASYRISKKEGAANVVVISMNKIVDGQEEVMGVDDFTVDAKKKTLTMDKVNRGATFRWLFAWKGQAMTGTLTEVANGAVIRNIRVNRK